VYTLGAMQVRVPVRTATQSRAPITKSSQVPSTTATPIQQPIIVVPQAKEKAEASETPWYKSATFVGSVASAVALAVVGYATKKLGGD